MISPIFVDTNIPIYAVGAPHPLKVPCARILALVAEYPAAFLTSAEVFQELLHRYRALDRWAQGHVIFQEFAALMQDRVEPVYLRDVEYAAGLADQYPQLAARDLVHVAVIQRLGMRRIVSADAAFSQVVDIERLDPALVRAWERDLA